jgi:hypothetical protein
MKWRSGEKSHSFEKEDFLRSMTKKEQRFVSNNLSLYSRELQNLATSSLPPLGSCGSNNIKDLNIAEKVMGKNFRHY